MKAAGRLLLFSVAAASIVSASEDITLTAEDGFRLRATFYPASAPGPCVLLLHQCNRDRAAYADLAPALAASGLHVLALDFRGFGESKSAEVTDFQTASERLWPLFAKDVDAALAYLVSRPGVDRRRIGILGASCGGSQALLAASRNADVHALIFLSSSLPWLSDQEIASFEEGRAIPVLCIAAEEDRGTYERAKRVFQNSKSPDTRLILYKGNAHGVPLFDQDPALIRTIVDWFSARLR